MMKPSHTILVVDDDPGHRLMLEALLQRWKFEVTCAQDGLEAVTAVKAAPFDVVLMDVRMAGLDGIAALKAMKAHNPSVPVVIMTAYSAVESAIEALKSGAYDYLIKPLDFDVLKLTLNRTLEHSFLKDENRELKAQLGNAREGMVGHSAPMEALHQLINAVAPSEATVLITGKSGTGKELVARAIHAQSSRSKGPWVAVNCAALAENLLESELFGHEKGAFTGADKRRDGRFLQAHEGTLFLDEIGEVTPLMQAKLLRAIQQREIQRVGSDETLNVNVRLVAATNRDLQEEVRAGRFREDLYYRLNVVSVAVPSLSQRPEDIPLLAQHFLEVYGKRNRKTVKGFTPQAMDRLINYAWPGNVRELENTVERAVVLLLGAYVSERELPPALMRENTAPGAQDPHGVHDPHGHHTGQHPLPSMLLQGTLEDVEREMILHTLEAAHDNKTEAAKRLGISRKTLHLKLKRYDCDAEEGE